MDANYSKYLIDDGEELEKIDEPHYRDASECAVYVHSLYKRRHEIFFSYITSTLSVSFEVNTKDDVKACDFFKKIGIIGFEDVTKSPDILFNDETTIFCGDIAVSKSVSLKKEEKRIKYEPIREILNKHATGYKVKELDFILKDDCSNITEINKELARLIGCCPTRKTVDNLIQEIININDIIDDYKRQVIKKQEFYDKLDELSHNKTEEIEDITYQTEFVDNYKPEISELELFKLAYADSKLNEGMTIMQNMDYTRLKEQIMHEHDNSHSDANPKSSVQFVLNLDGEANDKGEWVNGTDLLTDYLNDLSRNVKTEVRGLMPSNEQLIKMVDLEQRFKNRRGDEKLRQKVIDGTFINEIKKETKQRTPYIIPYNGLNDRKSKIHCEYLTKSKTRKEVIIEENYRTPSIHSSKWQECYNGYLAESEYLSSESKYGNSANLEFDIPDGPSSIREKGNIEFIKPFYEKINKSKALTLASSIRKMVNDVSRISLKPMQGYLVSVPLQGTGLIYIMLHNNVGSANPNFYYYTITRFIIDNTITINENIDIIKERYGQKIHLTEATENYVYVVSKLFTANMEKLSKLNNIDAEMRTHAMSMVVMAAAEKSNEEVFNYLNKYIGKNAMVMLDIHQKPSEILDNMKYLTGIVFSDMSSIDKLLTEKLNMMYKTNHDVALFFMIFSFLERNHRLRPYFKKNNIRIGENGVLEESFDIKGKFASFWDDQFISDNIIFYTSECQLVFQARAKKLYNSQFIDKACYKVTNNNKKMEMEENGIRGSTIGLYPTRHKELEEINMIIKNSQAEELEKRKIKSDIGVKITRKKSAETAKKEEASTNDEHILWADDYTTEDELFFPFDNEFSYSTDAIYYAQEIMNEESINHRKRHRTKIIGSVKEFGIYNLSMRGACKEQGEIVVGSPRSITSLLSGLSYLDTMIRDNFGMGCRIYDIVAQGLYETQLFNISEKEQRGPGRPIGSPNFIAKQDLYLSETIFKILSKEQNENLLVKGVNRNMKISGINKKVITEASNKKYKHIVHIVMDQSQFSEGDNCNKFIDFIRFNKTIPKNLKPLMINSELKHMNRIQYFPRVPAKTRSETPEYVINENAVKGKAGWVQGMKNIMSTYTHIAAVKWCIKSFNQFYKTIENIKDYEDLIIEQIVNSDDSYCIVAAKELKWIRDFYNYMLSAKKYFRLVQNKKKSYSSMTIGEIIQRFISNGRIINVWAKLACSVYNNMNGVDLAKDALIGVSTIQNVLKEGAPEVLLTYLRAEIKNKYVRSYLIGKNQFNDIKKISIELGNLPCELGGWPENISTYELASGGTHSQMNWVMKHSDNYKKTKKKLSPEEMLIKASMYMSYKSEEHKNILEKIRGGEEPDIEITKRVQNEISISNLQPRWVKETSQIDPKFDINLIRESATDKDIKCENVVTPIDDAVAMYQLPYAEVTIPHTGIQSHDGNFSRGLISCLRTSIGVSRKLSKTVEKLKSYPYVGTNLGGLYKERKNIQTAIADMRDNLNHYLLDYSEAGFSKSFRQKANANSIASTQKMISIGNSGIKENILNSYKILIKIYMKLEKSGIVVSDSMFKRALSDPSGKAKILENIGDNYVQTSTIPVFPQRVNTIPESDDEFKTFNDVQMVLIEYLKPGLLEDQGYVFRDPARLPADISTLTSIYSDWLELSYSKENTVKQIYFHILSTRRARYIIAPKLKTTTLYNFCKSVYENTNNPRYIIRGNINPKKIETGTRKSKDMLMINNVVGACCVLLKLTVEKDMAKEDVIESIAIMNDDGVNIGMDSFCNSDEYLRLFNMSNYNQQRYFAILSWLLKQDPSLFQRVTENSSFHVVWEKEQIKVNGEYDGEFIVRIQKGKKYIKLAGSPGDITDFSGNTLDMEFISGALYHLMRVSDFKGYPCPVSKERWGNTTFFKARNYTCSHKVVYGSNRTSIILPIDETDKGNTMIFVGEGKIQVIQKDRYSDYLGYNYTPNISGQTKGAKNKFKSYRMVKYDIEGETTSLEPKTNYKGKQKKIKYQRVTKFYKLYTANVSTYFANYELLSFGSLCMQGIYIDVLRQYNLLDSFIKGKLHTENKDLLISFITNEIGSHKLIRSFLSIYYSGIYEDDPFEGDAIIGKEMQEQIIEFGMDTNMSYDEVEQDLYEDYENEYADGFADDKNINTLDLILSIVMTNVNKDKIKVRDLFYSYLISDLRIKIENYLPIIDRNYDEEEYDNIEYLVTSIAEVMNKDDDQYFKRKEGKDVRDVFCLSLIESGIFKMNKEEIEDMVRFTNQFFKQECPEEVKEDIEVELIGSKIFNFSTMFYKMVSKKIDLESSSVDLTSNNELLSGFKDAMSRKFH